jgi:hypothetical protein
VKPVARAPNKMKMINPSSCMLLERWFSISCKKMKSKKTLLKIEMMKSSIPQLKSGPPHQKWTLFLV